MDEAKRKLVQNWLKKALHDLAAARTLAGPGLAVRDVAIYHCQQAAEKALKAYLVFWDQQTGRTHDLAVLLEKAAQIEPIFRSWADAADRLTPYATMYRYPGQMDDPEPEQLAESIGDAECIYSQAVALLPEEVHPDA